MEETDTLSVAFMEPIIHELANPSDVFKDTENWAVNIGIVHDTKLLDVIQTRDEHGLDIDFHNGPKSFTEALVDLSATLNTGRHVLIGIDSDYEEIVEENGWEYITLEEAADSAEWELKPE